MLDNYVQLREGVPTRLHFTAHRLGDRPLRDPLLGIDKVVTVLDLVVDEEDGARVSKVLSVTAQGLASQLQPYLQAEILPRYTFTLPRRGSGCATRYLVAAAPR